MEIRKILPEDLKQFWEIQKECLDQWSFEHLQKEYSACSDLYVGYFDEKKNLVGIAYGRTKDPLVILQGIAVKYEKWRGGIGTALLIFFEEQCKETDHSRISVGSGEGFVEKFYLKNDYTPVELVVKGKSGEVLLREKISGYADGIKKRNILRKKFDAKEVIFIMEKVL